MAVGLATALRIALDPYVEGVQFITFFLVIVITAVISGFGAGLLAAVLGTAATDFFVLEPRFSLFSETTADLVELLLFGSLAFLCVMLITRMRSEIEREQAEREWQGAKDRLQLAFDAAQLGWWEYDPIRGLVWWDGRIKEMFDVAEDRTDIEKFKRRVHPDELARVWAAGETALDPTNLTPYADEFRHTRDDGEVRWTEGHTLIHFEGIGHERRAVRMVGTAQDITERKRREEERKERAEREYLLMREVNHRAKNMLSVVDAIAHQTAAKTPEDFIERFSDRIQALSANQDLLIRNAWHGVETEDLVCAQLAPFRRSHRLSYRGARPQVAFECSSGASYRPRASRTHH